MEYQTLPIVVAIIGYIILLMIIIILYRTNLKTSLINQILSYALDEFKSKRANTAPVSPRSISVPASPTASVPSSSYSSRSSSRQMSPVGRCNMGYSLPHIDEMLLKKN